VLGESFVRLLSGDFWSVRNSVAESLRAEPEWQTFAPFEPVYGCPVYPELDAAEPVAAVQR
jgi:FADH2-dependent halogenase/halogenation protein CepH